MALFMALEPRCCMSQQRRRSRVRSPGFKRPTLLLLEPSSRTFRAYQPRYGTACSVTNIARCTLTTACVEQEYSFGLELREAGDVRLNIPLASGSISPQNAQAQEFQLVYAPSVTFTLSDGVRKGSVTHHVRLMARDVMMCNETHLSSGVAPRSR